MAKHDKNGIERKARPTAYEIFLELNARLKKDEPARQLPYGMTAYAGGGGEHSEKEDEDDDGEEGGPDHFIRLPFGHTSSSD